MTQIAALAVLLWGGIATSAEDTFTLTRKLQAGEVDRYTMDVTASLVGGELTMRGTVVTTIKKLIQNGEAEVETVISNLSVQLNGAPIEQDAPPPMVYRVAKNGTRIGKQAQAQGLLGFDYSQLASLMQDRPLTVGKTVAIEQSDPKTPKKRVKGTLRADSVVAGVAKLACDLEVWNEQTVQGPMKIAIASLVEVATAKPNQADVTITNLPPDPTGMQPSIVKIRMVRSLKGQGSTKRP